MGKLSAKKSSKKHRHGHGPSGSETRSRGFSPAASERSTAASAAAADHDDDDAVFAEMASAHREEGNRKFQSHDYRSALQSFEKAIGLLPRSQLAAAARLHCSAAACYARLTPAEHGHAVEHCDAALEASPRYSKALLQRARCLDALGRPELARRDVGAVLVMEPNNAAALDMAERFAKLFGDQGFDPATPETKEIKSKKTATKKKTSRTRSLELIYGGDVKAAEMPVNCGFQQLKEIVGDRFLCLKSIDIKFIDEDGDLVTIADDEDLRYAKKHSPESPEGTVSLHIAGVKHEDQEQSDQHWMLRFAELVKKETGFDYDECINLYNLAGAEEDDAAAEQKLQELASLALFNWGNVHMSRARIAGAAAPEDAPAVEKAYERACSEHRRAGQKYEAAAAAKPDFAEAVVAVAAQRFELARLVWAYCCAGERLPAQVVQLFDEAEAAMEKAAAMWEKKQLVAEEELSPMNILWGRMLYERSVVEFKLGLPSWEDCLAEAVEKFRLAGASLADVSVMAKNHCANAAAQEGLEFNIDEIVEAWSEMHDARRWRDGGAPAPAARLVALLRRRQPRLLQLLESLRP